jgi:crossover junction endodeoxyribonuclease RuvC
MDRLHTIGTTLVAILTEYQPHLLALETLFFNKNVKTALSVAEARGVVLYVARSHQTAVVEYSPQQIKVALTGYGNSDKVAVTTMVRTLVHNTPDTGHDDEYDAIAVAVTALAHHRS